MSYTTGSYTEADDVGLHRGVHRLGGFPVKCSYVSNCDAKDLDFLSLVAPGLGLQNLLELSLNQDKRDDSVLCYTSRSLGGKLRCVLRAEEPE